MHKILAKIFLFICLLTTGQVWAQSFAPGTSAADSVKKASQQVTEEAKSADDVKVNNAKKRCFTRRRIVC
jgi:hypothetical protein